MDAKKRVAVPASWLREAEGDVLHVVPHPTDGYLMVMPPAEFNSWEAKINAWDASPAEKRSVIRKFYSEAHSVTTDKQGRIVLLDKHCERAGLSGSGDIVFMGVGSRFEIWSKDRFHAADPEETATYERFSKNF